VRPTIKERNETTDKHQRKDRKRRISKESSLHCVNLWLKHGAMRGFSLVLGFGVSAGVGIFFGIYLVNLVAKLNPIEALK
jgi:hypothetical protein